MTNQASAPEKCEEGLSSINALKEAEQEVGLTSIGKELPFLSKEYPFLTIPASFAS
jgi:hypothetical protein